MVLPTESPADREGGYVVLPFYLLCDVSYSMVAEIPALNKQLHEFRDALAKVPVLADKVRFGVLDFSDTANVVVPLCDFAAAHLPDNPLAVRNSTSYAAAFRLLRRTIDEDKRKLKGEDLQVFRPAVFFLTDGMPNPGDDWQTAFKELTWYDSQTRQGNQAYPLFVPFGMGDADATLLAGLVHPPERSRLFMARAGANAAGVIEKMLDAMLKSVLASGRTVTTGQPNHVLPTATQMGPDIEVYDGGNLLEV